MIHQYKLGGYNIVLDIASGAVHAVDEVAYDIIEKFQDNKKEDVIAEISKKYPEIIEKIIKQWYYRNVVFFKGVYQCLI